MNIKNNNNNTKQWPYVISQHLLLYLNGLMKSEYTLGHFGWIYYNILDSVPRKFGNPQFVYLLNIAYSHILWHETVNG